MNLFAVDIGGSSIKYGLYGEDGLRHKGSFKTPETYQLMKEELFRVLTEMKKETEISGAAFSAPGTVDSERGYIGGLSAVSYIHHFNIREDLENFLGVPVTIENDANCAALAELYEGAAQDVNDVLFMVIGSGIGGAVIIDRKLYKGRNLFGGEFGYMLLAENDSLSSLGSPVQMARRYSEETGELVEGSEVFLRAEEGDPIAIKHAESLIDGLARGIFNLSCTFNPDRFVIGGGISRREDLIPRLLERTKWYLAGKGAEGLEVNLVPCAFRSDANLIGAAIHFRESRK